MSADSEPSKSNMKDFAGSPLDGEGEIDGIQNKEKFMDVRKTDERLCGPVVGNGKQVKGQVVCEGNDEERDTVDEIKLNRSYYIPTSGKAQGYLEEVNDVGGIANNMEERDTEEMIVKDNETVISGLDIKYTNIGEERKSLEMATDNMIHGGLAAAELQITGENLTDNPRAEIETNEVPMGTNLGNETMVYGLGIKDPNFREKRKSLELATDNMVEGSLATSKLQIMDKNLTDNLGTLKDANKLHTEVPMGTNLGNETVIYGLDIKDANIREESKAIQAATGNIVDGGLAASALQTTANYLTGNLQNEEEANKLNTEVPMGTNLDNETVVYGVDTREADGREERKSLEMATENMLDQALATSELLITSENITDNLQNEKEPNKLNTEVAMGTNLDNETVTYGVDINDANTREDGKSSEVATDNIVDGGFAASELQIMGKDLTPNSPNYKEANKLNAEVPMGTNLDNGKMECGREDASVANKLKASPNNVNMPKRRRLNRKAFAKTVLDTNEATMNEAKPQSLIGNDGCIEVNEADVNKHVKQDEKAETKPLVNIGRKLNWRRRKEVPQAHAGMTTANDEQKSPHNYEEPENKVNKETDEQDMKNEEAEKLQRNKEEKVEPECTSKMAVERSKSSKRVDIAGVIFLCSSETREECYNYRVLGLPACKRDTVSKIYKGMRLFLFDVELKMMYGIYKAAGPGGYNIEPRASLSQFPSQVRFTVVEDCVPLVEAKFRSTIKDNYYTKHKFNCELTSEQVKDLCKLFHDTSKRAQSKLAIRTVVTATPSPVPHERKRKRVQDSKRPPPISFLEHERSESQSEKGVRCDAVVVSERYHHHPFSYESDILYERETYSRPSAPATLYEPLPPQDTSSIPSYSYDGAMVMDMHRRDLALDHREQSLCGHYDPCVPYIEAHAFNEPADETSVIHAYPEPRYETSVRHDYLEPEYRTGVTHAYQEPAYEAGVSHAFREPEYEAGVTHAYREPAYETGVRHSFGEPDYETGASHTPQQPECKAGVTHAYREPTYETGVSHHFRQPTYVTGVSHAFREPTCETGVRLRHTHQYYRQQVEYYRHGEYHDHPPLPPHRRHRKL